MSLMVPLDMIEQHTSSYTKPNLDLPNYKKNAFSQRINQLHGKYDPNIHIYIYIYILFLIVEVQL